MLVVATAGHVDHGKSTLLRALTGMEPDRWEEERRRGLTIDLGFVWTSLADGARVGFVDVPGHERFITNMLAGTGGAPAVLLVVAADEGWMPQTEEHAQAIATFGIEHVVLAVTKSDLAPPEPVGACAVQRLRELGIAVVARVAVSATLGDGLDELRDAIATLATVSIQPSPGAPVRLWVDRAFPVSGAGTVVTGTLGAGSLNIGDELVIEPGEQRVTVRGLQSYGATLASAHAVTRVAVNLRGVKATDVNRGDALTTPDAWTCSREVDVAAGAIAMPKAITAHIGSAAIPTRVRVLSARAARLTFARRIPLHLNDRLLLRDPGSRKMWGAVVADVDPQPIARGGSQAVAASLTVPVNADDEVDRRGCMIDVMLRRCGLQGTPRHARRLGDWWVSAARYDEWRTALDRVVAVGERPPSSEAVRQAVGVPDMAVLLSLVADEPALVMRDGFVCREDDLGPVPAELEGIVARLKHDPFAAPEANDVRDIRTDTFVLGVRQGLLLHLGGGVYVGADAPVRAITILRTLPEPFTVAEARRALNSTRRVVVPLLEHLDLLRLTRRLDNARRMVVDTVPFSG